MKAILSFVRTTLIGGVIFVLPIGIVAVALAEVFDIAQIAGSVVYDHLFPNSGSTVAPAIAALLLLVVAAFSVGLFARSRLGVDLSSRIEKSVVGRFPLYPMIRQLLVDTVGGVKRLDRNAAQVVRVRLGEMTMFGFLMDRGPQEQAVVFLPSAPSALSGSVVVVPFDRVEPTDLTVTEVLNAMRGLGTGLIPTTVP